MRVSPSRHCKWKAQNGRARLVPPSRHAPCVSPEVNVTKVPHSVKTLPAGYESSRDRFRRRVLTSVLRHRFNNGVWTKRFAWAEGPSRVVELLELSTASGHLRSHPEKSLWQVDAYYTAYLRAKQARSRWRLSRADSLPCALRGIAEDLASVSRFG